MNIFLPYPYRTQSFLYSIVLLIRTFLSLLLQYNISFEPDTVLLPYPLADLTRQEVSSMVTVPAIVIVAAYAGIFLDAYVLLLPLVVAAVRR